MLNFARIYYQLISVWAHMTVPKREEIVPQEWGEYFECANAFSGRSWQTVHFEEARHHRSCVNFFRDAALLYYLPAFILASLEELRRDTEAWDVTEYTLNGIARLLSCDVTMTKGQFGVLQEYLDQLQKLDLSQEAHNDVEDLLNKITVIINSLLE